VSCLAAHARREVMPCVRWAQKGRVSGPRRCTAQHGPIAPYGLSAHSSEDSALPGRAKKATDVT